MTDSSLPRQDEANDPRRPDPTGTPDHTGKGHGRLSHRRTRLVGALGALVLVAGGTVALLERRTRPDLSPTPTVATPATSSTLTRPSKDALPDFGPYPRFDASSVYTVDITKAPVNPQSAPMVAGLVKDVADHWGGVAALNVDKYGGAFAVADARTPRRDVVFDDCQGKGSAPAGLYTGAKYFGQVPIPGDAVPAPGSDGHLAVWDPEQDTLWEFWVASKRADGRWQACWGGRIDKVGSAKGQFAVPYGVSAAGLAGMGYMVTLEEAKQERIEHAVGLTVMEAAPGHSWPANRDDGTSTNPLAFQEGTRLRLDPSVDVTALRLTPIGQAVAKAAQKYGFIVCDKGGAVAVMAETGDRWKGRLGTNPWSTLAEGTRTEAYQSLKDFPWDKLQVVAHDWGKPS